MNAYVSKLFGVSNRVSNLADRVQRDVSKWARKFYFNRKVNYSECVLQSQIPINHNPGRVFLTQYCVRKTAHTVDNNFFVIIVLNSVFIDLGGHNRQKVLYVGRR